MPYFFSELIIIFKNSQKYTSIQLLLRPFQKPVWLLFLAISILRVILKRLLQKPKKLVCKKLKNLLRLQWLFLILLLRSSYEVSMFQATQNSPYRALPRTLKQVVTQNYILITDYATARVLPDIHALKNITQIVNGSQLEVLEHFDNLPDNVGVLTFDTAVAVFMKSRLNKHTHYAVVRDKVANSMKCIFFPRLSYMASPFNYYIKQSASFGILQKYANDLQFENIPHTTDYLLKKTKPKTEVPLDFQLFTAIFRGMTILNAIAFVIFLLELLSKRYKVLLNIFQKYY